MAFPGQTINKSCEYHSDAISLRGMRAAMSEGELYLIKGQNATGNFKNLEELLMQEKQVLLS